MESSSKVAQQLGAIRALCDAVLAAVEAAGPDGVAEGHLYAAMMGAVPSITLCRFEMVRDILVRSGRIRRGGYHQLFLAEAANG